MDVPQRARELYDQQVRSLTIAERLQLVKLVIDDLNDPKNWQPEEEADWTSFSLESFQRGWDNPEDAVYDDWREAYGVSSG